MEYNGKIYLKCISNSYETAKNSGWIKTAPITPGKIYEILGETKTWNESPAYTIKPDKIDVYDKIWSKNNPTYFSYYKHLFTEPTKDELITFLRDLKINDILDETT
jgi:hypothetical protein